MDAIDCHERLQPLGYLAWAACGKDPGFTPLGILEHARRTARYSTDEVRTLAFEGTPPDAGELARRWHRAIEQAERIVRVLPPEQAGTAVLTADGRLFRGGDEDLPFALANDGILYHRGRIGGGGAERGMTVVTRGAVKEVAAAPRRDRTTRGLVP